MKSIQKIGLLLFLIFTFSSINAQSKTYVTETAKVYGNCSMCKSRIEKVANFDKNVHATWNVKNKMLTMTYDPKQTSKRNILKRIALAGYDSELFNATEKSYQELPNCCQYERPKKVETTTQE